MDEDDAAKRRRVLVMLAHHLLEDANDDDDDDAMYDEQSHIWASYCIKIIGNHRAEKWIQDRVNFIVHVASLRHKNKFKRMYRMSFNAFSHLVDILTPYLEEGRHYWKSGDARICPEVVIASGIRWFAGGSYLDICEIFHISKASFYRCAGLLIDAIKKCPELQIKFPTNLEEIRAAAKQFRVLSSENVMRGCIGALDGCFIRIKAPASGNVVNYYSGHYEDHGLNLQACCNHRCQFIFASVAAPGSVSDMRALQKTKLFDKLRNVPLTYYIVADAAYAVSEKILVPFTGSQRRNPHRDAFNFFLSQLRIRIEQAFGLLLGKWRILRGPMECSLANNSRIIMACCRLHNYVIDRDWAPDNPNASSDDMANIHDGDTGPSQPSHTEPQPNQLVLLTNQPASLNTHPVPQSNQTGRARARAAMNSLGYMPTVEDSDDSSDDDDDDDGDVADSNGMIAGMSTMRDRIVRHIQRNGLRRVIW